MATPMNTGLSLEQLEAEYQKRARASGLDPMQPDGQARGGVALPKAAGGPPMPGGPAQYRRTGEQTSTLKKALEAEMRGEAQRGPLERSMKQFDEMATRRTNTKVGSPMTGVADALANVVGAVGQGQTGNRERELNAGVANAKSAQIDDVLRGEQLEDELKFDALEHRNERARVADTQDARDYNRLVGRDRVADTQDARNYNRQVGRDEIGDEQRDRASDQSELKNETYVRIGDPEDIVNTHLMRMPDGSTVRVNSATNEPFTGEGYKPHKEFNPNSGSGTKRGKSYTTKEREKLGGRIDRHVTLQRLTRNFDPTKAQAGGWLPGEAPNKFVRMLGKTGFLNWVASEEFVDEVAAANQFEADMVKFVQAPERHDRYGASLTKSEQALFKLGEQLDPGDPNMGERLEHIKLVRDNLLLDHLNGEYKVQHGNGIVGDAKMIKGHAERLGFVWDEDLEEFVHSNGMSSADLDVMIDAAYDPRSKEAQAADSPRDEAQQGVVDNLLPEQRKWFDGLSPAGQEEFLR